MLKQRLVTIAFIALWVLLYSWFIWPTPYVIQPGWRAIPAVRINRFTGVREEAGPNGWH